MSFLMKFSLFHSLPEDILSIHDKHSVCQSHQTTTVTDLWTSVTKEHCSEHLLTL